MPSQKPSKPPRPSRAAMHRRLAAVEAEGSQRPALAPELAPLVEDYDSRLLTDEQMNAARPFLVAVLAASPLTSPDTLRDYRTQLAALAGYALERGKQLTAAQVLTTEFIDEYVRLGMAGQDERLQTRRRGILLNLARQANPGPTAPAKLPAIARSAVRPPYTPSELAQIVRVCAGQPTARLCRDLSAVVGMGAGAGLDSIDQRGIQVGHVADLGPARGLEIHVQQPRPRIVPVRASLEHLLRVAIEDRPHDELLIGVKPDRRNTAAAVIARAALYRVPHIEPARLRATWIADLMTDSVPLGVLLQAAGLLSARTLADLLPEFRS